MTPWFSATLETTTVIEAPPEKCLNFDRLPEWHTDFIKSTTITRSQSDVLVRGIEARPGDEVAILAGNFVGLAKLTENTQNIFSYEYTGRKLGLDATRAFHFLPEESSEAGSRTRFVHHAYWEGYAAVMFMAWSPIRMHVKGLFEGFHHDLKREVEKSGD